MASPNYESIEGPFREYLSKVDRQYLEKTEIEEKDDPWFIVLSMCTVSISMANLVS